MIFSTALKLIILLFFASLKLISVIKVNSDNLISGKLCKRVFAIIVSNLLLTNTSINLSFQLVLSSFLFWNSLMKILRINSVRHGDKSRVNNLNKRKAFSGSCELITTLRIF